MLDAFENIYKVIVRPSVAFNDIKEKRYIYPAVFYLFLFGIVSVIFVIVVFRNFSIFLEEELFAQLPLDISESLKRYVSSPYFVVLSLITPYLSVFISTSIYNLIAEFAVKKSNGVPLFLCWSFASVPSLISKVLTIFLVSAFKIAPPIYVNLIFVIWGIVLYVIAIERVYEINRGLAIGILFIPFVLVFVIFSLFFALLMSIFTSV